MTRIRIWGVLVRAWILLMGLIAAIATAHAGTLTIPFSFSPGSTILSSQMNQNFVAVATVVNGGLDHTNLSSSAGITLSQLNLNLGGQAFNRTTASGVTWCSGLTTDTVPSVAMVAGGGLQFGPGASGALDVALKRTASNTLQLNNASSGSATLDMNGGAIINVSSIGSSTTMISCTSLTASQGLSTGTNGGTGGNIIMYGATSGSATIGVQPVAGATTFNLPVGNGSSGNYIKGDGAGNLSYGNPTPVYVSPTPAALTPSSATPFTHGLGVIPSRVWFTFTCNSADATYASGDSVVVYPGAPDTGGPASISCFVTSSTVTVVTNTLSNGPTFVNKAGGTSSNITWSKWNVTVNAAP